MSAEESVTSDIIDTTCWEHKNAMTEAIFSVIEELLLEEHGIDGRKSMGLFEIDTLAISQQAKKVSSDLAKKGTI